jgi:hypothetical protein
VSEAMQRRHFITLLGGAAAAWPLAARAQQPKMLRVGFVGMQPREWPLYTNFLRRMAELGYQEGRNFAIAQALLERRSPSIAAFRENMEAGALISYGFDLMGLFYDIASYVHRIAGGANPSDMPIEQSPRFYMAVNLKTAASLGVSLSDVFIARANEVRE